MTPGSSPHNVPVAFRLPLHVARIVARRAARAGLTPGEYLKRRVVYDITRKHGIRRISQNYVNNYLDTNDGRD